MKIIADIDNIEESTKNIKERIDTVKTDFEEFINLLSKDNH